MSVKSEPYFWVTCDLCGVSAQEGSEHSAWVDSEQAEEEAEYSDWHVEGSNHLCPACYWPLPEPDSVDE